MNLAIDLYSDSCDVAVITPLDVIFREYAKEKQLSRKLPHLLVITMEQCITFFVVPKSKVIPVLIRQVVYLKNHTP